MDPKIETRKLGTRGSVPECGFSSVSLQSRSSLDLPRPSRPVWRTAIRFIPPSGNAWLFFTRRSRVIGNRAGGTVRDREPCGTDWNRAGTVRDGTVRDRLKRHRSKSSLWDTRLRPNADFRRLRRRLQRSITIATSAAAAEIHAAARERWPNGETDASRFIPGCRGRPASPDGEGTRPEPPEFPTGNTRLRPGTRIFIGVASDCPDLPPQIA